MVCVPTRWELPPRLWTLWRQLIRLVNRLIEEAALDNSISAHREFAIRDSRDGKNFV